jgi:hypothetical protein
LVGLPVHTPLTQSVAPLQILPPVHLPQLEPQSTSVSLPFLAPSLHFGTWHFFGLPLQTPLEQSAASAQLKPSLHLAQEPPPPQSTSVSLPFLALSLQLGVWQVAGLPEHTPLEQSPDTEQRRSFAHLAQAPPPQSTSVSVPFLTVSGQAGAWHFLGLPEHTPLPQSLAIAHDSPVVQRVQRLAPPQSTSVSTPFLTTSLQLGTWQMFEMHTPLKQSFVATHVLPLAQSGQVLPPQSTSVSTAFLTKSLQLGAAHLLAVQTLLRQSIGPPQARPVPHLPQLGPPQSTSISPPFLLPSKQLGA